MSSQHVLLAGCGDVGIATGLRMIAQGWSATGVRRRAALLPAEVSGLALDLTTAREGDLPRADALVVTLTADSTDADAYERTYVNGLRGLARARIAGRLERVVDQPLILLDGAHNAAGADALCHAVDELLKMKRLHVVMGMVRDKDYETCVHEVASRADDFYACVPDAGERSLDAHTIAELARQSCKRVYECESAEHAIELALEHAKMNDCILICGSLYLIGECEKILRGRPKATD